MDLTVTIAILAVAGILFAFGSWRSALPADPLKPRLIPWRPIILVSGVIGLFMIVHLVNLLGVQTGDRTGLR